MRTRHDREVRRNAQPTGKTPGGDRLALFALLALLLTGCSEPSSPSPGLSGDWKLVTVNGVSLPAQLQSFPQPTLTAAVLHAGFGLRSWDTCSSDDTGAHAGGEQFRIGTTGAVFPVTYPARLASITDTLTLDGDSLRWAFTNGYGSDQGRDVLTFVLLTSSTPGTDPGTCYLPS